LWILATLHLDLKTADCFFVDEASSAERRGRHRLEGIGGAACALLFLCSLAVLVGAFGATVWLMRHLRVARRPVKAGDPNAWSGRSLAALAKHLEAYSGYPAEVSTARVLVAGGDPVNQKATVGMLESLGVRADASEGVGEALEMIRVLPYDLVLMDCQMACRNGQEAIIRIRAREPAQRRTPIVAVTAETCAECLDRCLAGGMDDLLLKPIRMADLTAALQRWLPEDRAGHVAERAAR
jgi:CheY-like chemotaxis protein